MHNRLLEAEMENTHLWVPKEGLGKKNSLHSLCNEESPDFSESQPKKLVNRANSRRDIVVNMVQSQISKVSLKNFFFRRVHGQVDNRVPKNMVSVDEKYLRRCLELIHISAFKGARSSMPVNSRSTNMGIVPETLYSAKFVCGDACGSGQFIFESPVEDGTGSVVLSANAVEKRTLGTVMGSNSMINILNSHLFHQFGGLDNHENLSRMSFADAKGLICYDYMDSPSGLSISSSYKLEKETPMVKGHKFGSMSSVHERLASTSSTNSTYSEGLSFASPTLSQGMLQCIWKEGLPHFVFSADDQKEVYVAKLRKVGPSDQKALDYVYHFHLDKGGQRGGEISDNNSQVVGKMNVSTSFTLSSNNDKVMETEFVLFGSDEIYDKETCSSSRTQRKNKGLPKKVSQLFRTSPLSKHRTLSNLGGSNTIVESCPWEPHAIGEGEASLLETNVPPNLELAAIVVKDHIPCNPQDEVGGWGLKFLNKSRVKQTTLPSESCMRSTGDCSTSMSILIPAGLHGGPRTRNGGPSSLTDRWRSGGHCDCGGWDEGCPLTVLQRRSNKEDVLSEVNMQGHCKTVDLVTQSSRDSMPTLRMVNVHAGLYFVHFWPPLSALQSFSIAVAIIHTQSPTISPNTAQEL